MSKTRLPLPEGEGASAKARSLREQARRKKVRKRSALETLVQRPRMVSMSTTRNTSAKDRKSPHSSARRSRTKSQPHTPAKVGKSRTLTARQQKFLELKIAWPYPPSARAARLAGYSESVARKATVIIERSPLVRRLLEEWMHREDISDRALLDEIT